MSDPYREIDVNAFDIHFMGEPTGDGLILLQQELTRILLSEGNAKEAYLSKIQYSGENKVRVALIIDGTAPPEQMARVIAAECQSLVKIDILFFSNLLSEHKEQLRRSAPPFFTMQSAGE